ncbi:MAG TPA: hypothetical protein VM367_09950 [Pseudonocardia sp.]|jgi:hypothetical protein|nr:hypothetical protein [Pseudonocardia sp.]
MRRGPRWRVRVVLALAAAALALPAPGSAAGAGPGPVGTIGAPAVVGRPWVPWVAAVGAGVVLGGVVGFGLARARPAAPPAPARGGPVVADAPSPPAGFPVPAPPGPVTGAARREPTTDPVPTAPAPRRPDALVLGLIGSHDLAADDVQRRHVEQVLRGVGVVVVAAAVGDEPHPGRHEIVGTVPPAAPADIGRIARVVRPGWARGPDLVRPAQVVVHRRSPA